MMRKILPLLILAATLVAAGCDYTIVESEPGPVAPGTGISVVVTPGAATIAPGATLQLRAIVTGTADTTVAWRIASGPGAVSASGLFTAPADSTGTATVRATLVADTSKWSTSTITITRDTGNGNPSGVRVTITPVSLTMLVGTTQQFVATVTGSTDMGVRWVVEGGPGTINQSGLYTAPESITSVPTSLVVRAIASADSTASGRALVRLTIPVDPSRICFDRDIKPIFASSCAVSGCHDQLTHKDDFDFTTARGILRGVKRGDPNDSKIYESITDDEPKDRMPLREYPTNVDPLTAEQIDLIRRWIAAGADTTNCPPKPGLCDTTTVSYSQVIRPLIEANACIGCHATAHSGNRNVELATYDGVARVARSGQLKGSLTGIGYVLMPQGGPRLDQCTIDQFTAWIDRGAPND